MNRSNSVLGIMDASKGVISGTITDVRILFQVVIKANATNLLEPETKCKIRPSVTTIRRSGNTIHTDLINKDLTPGYGGQYLLDKLISK